jgi:hypothetical protein
MGLTYAGASGVHKEASDAVLQTSKVTERTDVATIATAGAETYTAAQILGGIILRDCAGGDRTDTLPTAALMIAAMREPKVGDTVRCLIINNSDAAETITIQAGTSGTVVQVAATAVIAQNASKTLHIRVTGVSTPTYDAYI